MCLEEDSFKLNKCDPCVANENIDIKQCTNVILAEKVMLQGEQKAMARKPIEQVRRVYVSMGLSLF